MKLLFDENLPPRLVPLLAEMYPLSTSLRALGFDSRPDELVWAYARAHGFMVATKDIHFYRFCVSRGYPPKMIWVRTGNCSVQQLVEVFTKAKTRLELFELDDQAFLLLK